MKGGGLVFVEESEEFSQRLISNSLQLLRRISAIVALHFMTMKQVIVIRFLFRMIFSLQWVRLNYRVAQKTFDSCASSGKSFLSSYVKYRWRWNFQDVFYHSLKFNQYMPKILEHFYKIQVKYLPFKKYFSHVLRYFLDSSITFFVIRFGTSNLNEHLSTTFPEVLSLIRQTLFCKIE